MKKLFVLLTVLFLGQLSAAELSWNKNDNFKDWKRSRFCTMKVVNGVLTLTDIAFDCLIINDALNINPADYNAISIRYRAEGIQTPSTGEIFFCHGSEKYSEKRRWTLPSLISDGKWHTLTVSPKNLKSWLTGGNITSLRIDMVNKPGGKIEIAEIKLHKITEQIAWSGKKLAQWKYFYNCDSKLQNDILVVKVTKTDSRLMALNLDVNPKDANTFIMVYRATGTPKSSGELYFAKGKDNYSDARKWRIPALIADGKWHTMKLTDKALNNHAAWYGPVNITKLRLDPTNAAGGTIEIKEIRFEKSNTAKPLPKLTLKPVDEPDWKPVVSQLKKKDSEGAYFRAKMIKAPQDTPQGKMMRPFYVRRKITLKDTPAHAKLQFTADDYSQVVINGKDAAFSNSWRETVVCDVAHLLKKGENILGFQYFNKDTWGGVFGELYVQYPDGSSEKISTDGKFKSTDKTIKGWATLAVDDSSWDNVIEQPGPPNKPWHTTLNYFDYKDLQKITNARVSGKKFKWGETFRLQMNCEGKRPEKAISFRVVLYSRDTVQWADTVTIPAEKLKTADSKHWSASFDFELPYYIPAGTYEIRLESPQFSVNPVVRKNLMIALEPAILKNPKFSAVPDFRVVRIGNAPRFQLNGKPFYMSLAKCHSHFGDQSPKVSGDAPFSAVNPSPNYEKWHPRVGIYDFSEFDRVMAKVVRSYPNAYIIVGLDLYVPHNFHHSFPDEMVCDVSGKRASGYKSSIFSKKAAEYLRDTAIKAMEHVENSPYANRVIGYRIGGGYTTEFLGWEPGSQLDFSKVARRGFQQFASKHYPALKNFRIPTQAERSAPAGNLLWNPAEHLSTVAYFDSYSNANAELVATICKGAKAYLKKRNLNKVVGSYFGYVATLNHTGVAQMRAHYALRRLLQSNTVDFLMSPQSYPLRNLGDIVGDMKPFSTLNSYNVISFAEDDTRTHNTPDVMSTPGSRSQVITETQSINIMRRNIGVYLCRNQPENYNPMFTGSFNFKSLERDIAIRRVLGDFCEAKQLRRNAEVAIVVSEKAIVSMPVSKSFAPSGYVQQLYRADGTVEKRNMVRNIPNYEMYVGNQGRFMRTGAPVDIVLAEALETAKPYKVYVFMNCFNYDQRFLETVRKLQQKKCTLLWVYAPGYAYQNNASVKAMNQLTGFQFKQIEKSIMPAVTLADGSYHGTPTTRVKPVFAVTDSQLRVLGRYEDGSVGLASRKVGNSLSFFSGPWQLGLPFLSQVLKESGVHIFSETGDPMEANDNLVVLHARTPGKKKITLPRKATVLDVYANQIVARNVSSFEYVSALHETRLFYYGDDAEELQKQLQKSGKF